MFSENLKQTRKRAGLSQEELANQLHVTRQTLAKWESAELTAELLPLRTASHLRPAVSGVRF